MGQVTSKRRVLNQDFVQWGGGGGPLKPSRAHGPRPELLALLGHQLRSVEGRDPGPFLEHTDTALFKNKSKQKRFQAA